MERERVWRIFTDVETAKENILKRHSLHEYSVPEHIIARSLDLFGERVMPDEAVRRIIKSVREGGDKAVFDWNKRIDRIELDSLLVPAEDLQAALEQIPANVRRALEHAAERIRAFHQKQPITSWIDAQPQGSLGQLVRPMDSVGVYVPGGTAPLPSSLLMSVIPAQVAGVKEIIVCTPPGSGGTSISPVILAAAAICGIEKVYRVGGAQAIAAMAYGTESIPRVAVIVGAGGLFTVLAKRQVFGDVGIEGLPGPTETVVIADDSANPKLAAADLLAQAEHDVLASAILLTPSQKFAEAVNIEIYKQLEQLSRNDTILQAMETRSGTVITKDLTQAFAIANEYAAEHLCLLVENPWAWVGQVRNAGGIFLGEHSYEVLGDYIAGPSHVMPTGGTARFASPLNVLNFVKLTSLIGLDQASAIELSETAEILATAESLTAHATAARYRREMK